jgi:hypothetical protein
MPYDWPESKNAGGVLATFLRDRFPRDRIKMVARELDCTLDTAANALKGKASERTLTKALQVWPWELSLALGQAFSGQTYDEHLNHLIEETQRVADRRQAQRARTRDLEARAAELGCF